MLWKVTKAVSVKGTSEKEGKIMTGTKIRDDCKL